MNQFQEVVYSHDTCSWCFDEIINEVYVLSINKTYCRTQCMVSDLEEMRLIVKLEQEGVELSNQLALIKNDTLYI